jgi:cardiolipin synthase (CMP-forming)
MPRDWLAVPNLITYGRLALVPVFVVLQAWNHPQAALWTFIVAMSSDLLDGVLARLLNQRTKLGALLDPIADKLLVFSALVMLVAKGPVPPWLLAIVVARDAMMAAGAMWVKFKNWEIPSQPTRIGKYATFALTCTIVLALISLTTEAPLLNAYVAVLAFIAGLCVLISTVQYFARFGYLIFVPARSRSSLEARNRRRR